MYCFIDWKTLVLGSAKSTSDEPESSGKAPSEPEPGEHSSVDLEPFEKAPSEPEPSEHSSDELESVEKAGEHSSNRPESSGSISSEPKLMAEDSSQQQPSTSAAAESSEKIAKLIEGVHIESTVDVRIAEDVRIESDDVENINMEIEEEAKLEG